MIFNRDRTDAYGRQIETEEPIKKPFFRSSYEKFFDGYTTTTITNPSGKTEKVRIYTGTLFHQELTQSERKYRKIQYSVFLVFAIMLLIIALALPVDANSNIWCFLSAMPYTIMCFYLVFAMIAYLPAEQNFKLHEYHDGAQIIAKKSMGTASLSALPIIASFVLQLFFKKSFDLTNLLSISLFAGSGILIALVGISEQKVSYIPIETPDKIE